MSSISMPGDIMHCPSKRVYASWVIEKHLARVGLNCYDVVAITRDGGGERERARGVHRYFEDFKPGYVRLPCGRFYLDSSEIDCDSCSS